MASYLNNNDLYFTSEGDYCLSETGDIASTEKELYRGLIQQILTRIMSSRGDWPLQPVIGAGIGDFLGSPNTRETGERIKVRVLSELVREGLLSAGDLSIDVVPTSDTSVAILILVRPQASQQAIYLTFTYNLSENKLVPRNI